jgi:cytidylate kinase
VVAIDGPAGSGKSTTARGVARALGFRHIDTGAMYRAVALKALREGVDTGDGDSCARLASELRVSFEESPGGGQRVIADGQDVTLEIRSPAVTGAVSPVSAHGRVRAAMVRRQRALAERGGAVLEGRDIGTVVLPGADVKVYLVASNRVRAERRMKELTTQGVEVTVEEVERDIARRDEYDSSRETSPLQRAVGSVELDTTNLTIDEQVGRVVEIAHETAGRLSALSEGGDNPFAKFRIHYRIGCILIQGILRVLFGLRVTRSLEVNYKENYIFACNHLSYMDPPGVGSTLPREVHFVAKSALFENPLFGWLIRTFNAIPLRRGVFDREAMKQSVLLLEGGRSMMIFPEGTRQSGGRLGKPKSGVGYLAVSTGVAVIPVYVTGTNRLLRCLFRRHRLRVAQGSPIRQAPGTRPDFDDNDGYRAFSEMVMQAIQALKDRVDSEA